jgi:hypothetical protein
MKRVVNGKAYNTETAEKIARSQGTYNKGSWRNKNTWGFDYVLYRIPKGAWFRVETE